MIKSWQQINILFISGLLTTGCFKNKVGDGDAESGLATVDIATPTKQDLERAYGPNCAKSNLHPQVLAKASGKTGCDALVALTNEYRLTIEGGACADGSEGTDLAASTGQLNNQSIQTSLKCNCDYSVKLELGLDGAYYFDNSATWRNNLPRSAVTGPTAELTIRLRATGAGEQAGLPPGSEVKPTGFTNLKIEVNFGDGAGEEQGQAPDSGTSNAGPIEFVAPEGWNGLTFQGDSLFSLQKVNQ